MAGIQGQPAPKPSNLPPPTPTVGAADPYDVGPSAARSAPNAPNASDPYDAGPKAAAAPAASAQSYQGPGSSTLQGIANIAPEGMGIAGGIAGRTAGIPGMTGMGMAMAAGGMGIRQVIEQDILGSKPKQDATQRLADMTNAAGKIGAELLTGEAAIRGVVRGGAAAIETKLGGFLADKMSKTAQPIVDYVSNFADGLRKNLIKPAADWIEQNMATGTAEQSGDSIKQKLQQVISDKFEQFQQRYADINSVAGSTPMTDAKRLGLTAKLREDAVDLPQNIYGMVKNYAGKIDAGGTAQDVHQVISDVNNEISRLSTYQTSPAVRDKLSALQQFSDRATDYMENYTHDIAKRISTGNATMGEMQGFQKMMEQQANPTAAVGEQNLKSYAKSVANDYIEQRKGVNVDYAKYRGFLDDTGEQAGVRAQGLGPMQFMRELDRKPSEQLVQNMFLPKNAAALREMSTASPEVFQEVRAARIRDIYNKSMVDGKIDLKKFAGNFNDVNVLPESSRPLIISDADRTMLSGVANQNGVGAIDRMHNNVVANAIKGVIDMSHAGALATAKIAKDAYGTNAGKVIADQIIGGAGAMATGNKPLPGQGQ